MNPLLVQETELQCLLQWPGFCHSIRKLVLFPPFLDHTTRHKHLLKPTIALPPVVSCHKPCKIGRPLIKGTQLIYKEVFFFFFSSWTHWVHKLLHYLLPTKRQEENWGAKTMATTLFNQNYKIEVWAYPYSIVEKSNWDPSTSWKLKHNQ